MGEVIWLSERRGALRRHGEMAQMHAPVRARFYFDLACPGTYLLAERVERTFSEVDWVTAVLGERPWAPAARRDASERAAALRMPLVWPDHYPAGTPAAMRMAAAAVERGRGAAFILAATRLAFCGGFDLDDPDILAEAAAAAGFAREELAHGSFDAGEGAGGELLAAGVRELPALEVGGELHWGERRVSDAITAARWARAARLRTL